MGTDIYSCLIVGEKIRKKTREAVTTKYDPDTGKPYDKSFEEEHWVYELDGKEVPEKDLEDDDQVLYVIYECAYEECSGEAILGILVGQTESIRYVSEGTNFRKLDPRSIEEAAKKYLKETNRVGKIYLATEES